MNDNAQPTDAKVSARRRLLRGAFSAPTVLTLYSGSVLAASSSKCLVTANAMNPPPTGEVVTYTPPTPAPDTYLRVRLFVSTASGGSVYWLKYNDISTFAGASSIISGGAGKYRRFYALASDGANYNKLSTTSGEMSVTNPPGTLSLSNKWAALRINNAGALVGVGSSGSGAAIGSSCWTSLST